MNAEASDLEQRLIEYADQICRLVERLPDTRAGLHAAGQLLRSGISPLPMLGAARAAGSKDEFIGDLTTCLRDLEQARRWLQFIRHVPLIQPVWDTDPLLWETESLIRILAARLWTARCKSALRWQLRQPRPVGRRRRSGIWSMAKRACGSLWPGGRT